MRVPLYSLLFLALFALIPVTLEAQVISDESSDLDDIELEEPKPKPRRLWKAGWHEKVPAASNNTVLFHLYLPKAIAEASAKDPKAKFPSLYIHNPSGRVMKDMKRYAPWADQRGVILVGIPKIRNGFPDHQKRMIQGHILKSLDLMEVPVHPFLRFTIGMSGGSADGERMVRWHGGVNKFAGTAQAGVFRLLSEKNKGMAIVSMQGARDRFIVPRKLYADLEKAKARGTHMKLIIDPDRAHQWGPVEEQYAMLSWMVGIGKLTHPLLKPEEKAMYLSEASTEIAQLDQIKDLSKRRQEIERLMDYPPLQKGEYIEALNNQWLDTLEQQFAELKSPARLSFVIDALESFPATLLKDEQREKMESLTEKLKKNPAELKEYEIQAAFRKLVQQDILAGLDKKALYEVALAYQAFIKAHPDHALSKSVEAKTEQLLKKYSPK